VYIVTNEAGEDIEIKKREWRTQVRKDRKLYSYLKTKAVDEIILDFGIREDTPLAVEEEDFSVFEKEEDYEDKVLAQTSPVTEPLETSKPKKEKKRAKNLSEFSAKPDVNDEEESDLVDA
jgi:hypothetical protein